jgi:1,4-dihydroxy-2-naphthoate octaprenyltransferase
MARMKTIPMGAALVGFGAFGARRAVASTGLVGAGVGLAGFGSSPVRLVRAARLLLGMTLTCLVTAGSMLINDYHDHKLGVDNAKVITPDEP